MFIQGGMDIYTFILNLIGIIGALIIGGGFLYLFGIRPQIKRLVDESHKLQLKINNIKAEIGDYTENTGAGLVKNSIGTIGIDGLMKELGIDPSILKNPLVRGLVDRYAPKVLDVLAKQGGKDGVSTETKTGFM